MKESLRLDRRIRVNALYDLYAPLLTQRQRDVYEMRCFSDLTLAEISETLEITRQAVHILVNRTEERLLALEEDLGFAAQVERLENRIKELEANELEIKKLEIKKVDSSCSKP
ncbi:MAG: DNA-binding protein [Synergistaceae bacterium]|nr:DNA-binding protein [Synergistaceae bacterium]